MELIVGLLLVSVLLALAEVLVPGAVLGIISFIALCAATYLTFQEYGMFAAMLVFTGASVVIIVALFLFFRLMQKTGWTRSFFLTSSVKGNSTNTDLEETRKELLGKRAETLTALAPTGMIQVDGKQFEAYSQSGFLEKGASCEVTGVETYRVLVKSTS